jgi:hypothetical protein
MSHNPILDELHAAREQLLADVDGDVHRYVEEAKRRTLASGRVIAEPKRRATPEIQATRSAASTAEQKTITSPGR